MRGAAINSRLTGSVVGVTSAATITMMRIA